MKYTMADYEAAARFIRAQIGETIKTAVVLGSGLGGVAGRLEEKKEIPYRDIPGFPVSTVASHAGKLLSGVFAGKKALFFSGRVHYYEGYDFEQVAFPIRVLGMLGVERLVLTNAAGGVNQSFSVGDFMLIADQINFMACAPLRGEEQPALGPRFFDMTRVYDPDLNQAARRAAGEAGVTLREGVYFYMPGPQFETPAEIRAIRTLGGDAVGMSTVVEAMAARQAGIRTVGISFISNLAAGMSPAELSDEDVVKTANQNGEAFTRLVEKLVGQIGE